MEYEKYLVFFTTHLHRKKGDRDYYCHLIETLEKHKEQMGIKAILFYDSTLTKRCFTYILQQNDMDRHIGGLVNIKVLKITQDRNPFIVDEQLDDVIKECTLNIEGLAYTLCFYLIEDEGRIIFYRISRYIDKGEITDDDHLNLDGSISGHPDMFYEHFYGNEEYNAEDTAYLAKMLLTVEDRGHYDF